MPYKSSKQMRYLYKNEPEVAKKWTKKYGAYKPNTASKLEKKLRKK